MSKRMFRRDVALRLLIEAEDRLTRSLRWIAAGEEGEDPAASFTAVNREFERTQKKLRGFIEAAKKVKP